MTASKSTTARLLLVAVGLSLAAPAAAIPAFARKYTTSCLTCHTVYPKLTPFGEAFRRNGYMFPGVDSDVIKAEQVPMGQEANKKTFPETVWPSSIPASVPLSVGANGKMVLTPSKTSSAGLASHGTQFTLQDLAPEAHLWAGASVDDNITVWAELTFADGGADIEHAQLLFNNLIGPKHAVNLIVGHGFPNVTQFGPHSSYLADAMLPTMPVTAIYRPDDLGVDPWTLVDNYTGVEVNGVIAGRLDYALGLNAGKTAITAPTDNFYGRIGFKVGGMRLDGEGSSGTDDAKRPWAEDAIGVYAFGYQSHSRPDPELVAAAGFTTYGDTANVFGVGARGQLGSAELNAGFYSEKHNHASDTEGSVTGTVAFGELSYIVYPWLVPAIRVERFGLKPEGGTSISNMLIQPGLAILIRPNIKLVTVFNYEMTNGFPSLGAWTGGASDFGQHVATAPASGATKLNEFESIGFFLAWAN
jgi:hypothetical protein